MMAPRRGSSQPGPQSMRTLRCSGRPFGLAVPRSCSNAVLHRPARAKLCSRGLVPRAAPQEDSEFDVDNAPAPDQLPMELGPRDDDVLPNSLADAISEAAQATALAINNGNSRCQVEVIMDGFWDPISGPCFPNKGDQERFWRMTRRFVEELAAETKCTSVKAVYPDTGVSAMLSHQWQDRSFNIDSLNSRRPVKAEDELLVMACPDPQGADDCRRVVSQWSEQDEKEGVSERPVVLFNQRLSSGDVGIGLNARRLRDSFLQRFTITYSLRPIGDMGSVFRRYPDMWKVFVEDPELPGRYRLIAERPSRPAGEGLDYIIDQALGRQGEAETDEQPTTNLVDTLRSTMRSMNRFMKSLQS